MGLDGESIIPRMELGPVPSAQGGNELVPGSRDYQQAWVLGQGKGMRNSHSGACPLKVKEEVHVAPTP